MKIVGTWGSNMSRFTFPQPINKISEWKYEEYADSHVRSGDKRLPIWRDSSTNVIMFDILDR
jgi:hypothetical protein